MTELQRPVIAQIVQTCRACPSQWEGFFVDGRAFYIRYRYGHLRVTVHPTDPLRDDAEVLLDGRDEGDDGWGGEMAYDELRSHLDLAGISAPTTMSSASLWHHHIVPAIQDLQQRAAKVTA